MNAEERPDREDSEDADFEVPYTDEEIRELAKQPRGRPLAEILAELERGAGQ